MRELFLVLLIFGPFWGSFRIDHFLFIFIVLLFTNKSRRTNTYLYNISIYSFLFGVLYILFMLFTGSDLKLTNYVIQNFWYLPSALVISTFKVDFVKLTNAVLGIALVNSVLTLAQYLQPNNVIVDWFLSYYGGPKSSDYLWAGHLSNIPEILVKSGASMVGIFTGKHSIALFCLLVELISVKSSVSPKVLIIVRVLNVIAGFLSGSKIFVVGIFIVLFLSIRKNVVLLVTIFFMSLFFFFYGLDHRILENVILLLVEGDFMRIFESRYGDNGFFVKYNEIFRKPIVWILGLGSQAGAYKVSDNLYRSLLLLGGVPMLVSTLFVFMSLANFCRSQEKSFFLFLIILFLAGIGVPSFWSSRTNLIFFIMIFSYEKYIAVR